MSSAKRDGDSYCGTVTVPVPVPVTSRTRAGAPSRAGNSGVLARVLRVLRGRERGGLGGGTGASAARCTVQRSALGGRFLRGALARSPVPHRSPAHLAAEGTGKAGAVVFQRFASLENK